MSDRRDLAKVIAVELFASFLVLMYRFRIFMPFNPEIIEFLCLIKKPANFILETYTLYVIYSNKFLKNIIPIFVILHSDNGSVYLDY